MAEEERPKRLYKPLNGVKIYSDFKERIKALENPQVAIFSHPCPDPDALASMMGMGWMLNKEFGIESQMYYAGEISHPQNGSMVNLLTPDLRRISEYRPDRYNFNILVDTIPEHAGCGANKIRFDLVVDHHRDLPHDFEGFLIHKKSGSCAGIVYDLMKGFVSDTNWFSDEIDQDQKVATALIAGVMTDTNFMLSEDCTEYERVAFNELYEYKNSSFLHQIIFFKRRKFWVDCKASACRDAKVDNEGIAIVGLGLIPEKERDLIADMADEMVMWASVETAIAFGVIGGDRIEGSVRSSNASLNVPDLCHKLGTKHGSGGGKQSKGAYQLPLGGLSIDQDEDDEDAQEVWESIKKRESKRISRILQK